MHRSALIALLCVFLAFTATDIVSRDIFERLPHLEDEFAYLYQARLFARGHVVAEPPAPAHTTWQPFLITVDGRRFGKYTPGWPLLLAVGAGLDLPWIVNAWFAMLTVALVYRLGRALYSPTTGAVAALLTATSPAALLLNSTLMAHTAALFFTTLFLYALWRIERARRAVIWGVIAGLALGLLVLIRPITAVAVAVPFVILSGGRVLWAALAPHYSAHWLRGHWSPRRGWIVLRPLLVLGIVTIGLSLLWPAFNYRATAPAGESFPSYLQRFLAQEKDTDLYRYIWDYDRFGFGPGHGRNKEEGHTLEAGLRNTKKDLRCASRDLFGWAEPSPDAVDLPYNPCAESGRGYSWLLLPVGFLLGVWRRWTWLLLLVPICLVGMYVGYWTGGRLYTARYFYEALTAVALLSAVGLTGLIRLLEAALARWRPRLRLLPAYVLYGGLVVLSIYALAVYSPARLRPLRGYGNIGQAQIEQVQALRREPDRPLVVIAVGDHKWRMVASLMAITGPFLDDDIVLVRDTKQKYVDVLREYWKDREQIFFVDGGFQYEPPGSP